MKMLIYLKEILALLESDYSESIPFDEISISQKYVRSVTDFENLSKITCFSF